LSLLRLNDISVSYKGTYVLDQVSCVVSEGDRIGIIGPNGSGKSTLLKVIIGEITPEKGNLVWSKQPRIGYVPQTFPWEDGSTPLDVIGIGNASQLGRFGVSRELWERSSSFLSGGEKTRVLLAKAFLNYPDVLILDEPTNHVDIAGIQWLETILQRYQGTVLVSSHDRYFLDSVSKKIWLVEGHCLKEYSGNYSSYMRMRKAELAYQEKEHAKWQREVENLVKEVRDRRQWYDKAHKDAGQNDYLRRRSKKHAKQFKAKERRIENLMEEKPQKPVTKKPISVNLEDRSYRTKTILRGEKLSFKYESDSPYIFQNADFRVSPGEKIALLGPNGSGKTTLIRLFAGELTPTSGTLYVNPNIQIGYLSQMLEGLDGVCSAAENVSKKTGRTVSDARNILGYLGISGEKQILPLSSLSMGERSRVALACLTFAPYDLLLLDEPTNHLDLIAREGVEEALDSFPGAVIVSTHDRFLANRLSSSIWYLEDRTLETYKGTYQEFQTWRLSRDKTDDKGQKATYDRTGEDLKAQELAARLKIAEIVSKLDGTLDPVEKAALEKEYQEALKALQALIKD